MLYTDDKSVAYDTKLSKEEDVFTFNYVLEGDYILRVDTAFGLEYREVPVPGGIPPIRRNRVSPDLRDNEKPLHVGGEVASLSSHS